jgi:hypothetical protein
MRLMLLAGSALGASPPQNLCSLASVPFGGIVIRHRHGPYPHPPAGKNIFHQGPIPECLAFFDPLTLSISCVWQKIFQVVLRISGFIEDALLALAFGCSHKLVPKRLRSRQPHSSLISGLLGVEASGIRSKAFLGTKA